MKSQCGHFGAKLVHIAKTDTGEKRVCSLRLKLRLNYHCSDKGFIDA